MAMSNDLTGRIQRALDEDIRPGLQAGGGDIELVAVERGVVSVRLTGGCGACPSTAFAILMDIERQLRARVPEVEYLETAP
jgi:Fe-S cluster biogenesis protein NfuA